MPETLTLIRSKADIVNGSPDNPALGSRPVFLLAKNYLKIPEEGGAPNPFGQFCLALHRYTQSYEVRGPMLRVKVISFPLSGTDDFSHAPGRFL